jgi:hypothetical protein
MARTVKAFCSGAMREHDVGVDQAIYDMWTDHGSPLYQSKPLGLGGQIECQEHHAWAFLPGATPQQIVEPPHVRMSRQGAWNERGYYE